MTVTLLFVAIGLSLTAFAVFGWWALPFCFLLGAAAGRFGRYLDVRWDAAIARRRASDLADQDTDEIRQACSEWSEGARQ